VVSAPSPGEGSAPGAGALVLVGAFFAVAVVAIGGAQRVENPTRRAFLLGAGAGILFALVAVLLKLSVTSLADEGPTGMLTSWPPYLLVVAGLAGVLCNQVAYRTARLSSSMPVLNVVDCLVALFFGYVVLGELPRHNPGALAVELLSLAAMLTGLWVLARDVGAAVTAEIEAADGPLVPPQRPGGARAEPEPTRTPRR
jgi:hypothetical protein